MEINFVDPFNCKGYRFKGTTRTVPKGALEFIGLAHHSPSLRPTATAMVVKHVTDEVPITSPAYDVGATSPVCASGTKPTSS